MTTDWISVKDRLPEVDPDTDLLLAEMNIGKNGVYYFYGVGTLEKWISGDDVTLVWNMKSERYIYANNFADITHWAKIEPPEVTE